MKRYITKKNLILLILVVLFTMSFRYNCLTSFLNVTNSIPFETFQRDSENLVFAKMYVNKQYENKTNYGLVSLQVVDESGKRVSNEDTLNEALRTNRTFQHYQATAYISSVGLQGHVFSILYNQFHFSIDMLYLINCLLLSIVLVYICFMLYKKYTKILAVIWYLTFLLSPWVIAFARNLYWVEFTWFLPAMLALKLSMNYKKRRIYIPLIGGAIFLKCLCGYEYISTIMLFTISFFIIDFFETKSKEERKKIMMSILFTGISCVIGFLLAISVHGIMRGNGNIFTGINDIIKQDVARRTINISSSEQFMDTVYKDSITATTMQTIKKYLNWNSNIVIGIKGRYFKKLVLLTILILSYYLIYKKENSKRDCIMFLIFTMTTLSWFILGKAHSYIHTHINFVLWYFGFIQMCIYMVVKAGMHMIHEIAQRDLKELQ